MRRVTPSAFLRAVADGLREGDRDPFGIREGDPDLKTALEGLLWPDLLKFFELLYRRFDPVTRQPLAQYKVRKDPYATRHWYARTDAEDRRLAAEIRASSYI